MRGFQLRALAWMSMSLAFAGAQAFAAGGIWSRAGQVPAKSGQPVSFASPDRSARVEVSDHAVRYIGSGPGPGPGLALDLGITSTAPQLVEVLWAPNGRAFAINAGDRDAVGGWKLSVFRVVGSAKPIELPVDELLLGELREFAECAEREIPNVAAVSWTPGSFQLLAVAQVPPHSSCRNKGALRGFRVALDPLRIEAALPEKELRVKWANVLGSRLVESETSDAGEWPAVRPVELRKRIETGNARVRVPIVDASSGAALYELRCDELDARDAEAEGGEPYYGMFSCRLWQKRAGDLLRADADWEDSYTTRGVFAFEQVVGPCKSDAYFGRRREFHLRGLKLVLAISGFESPPIAKLLTQEAQPDFRFDFDVSIASDAAAKGRQAANPPGPYCSGFYTLDAAGKAVYEKTVR